MKSFADCALTSPPSLLPAIVGTWIHSEHLGGRLWFQRFWKVNKYGAFSILRQVFDL